MIKNPIRKKGYGRLSEHTRISYYLGIISFMTLFFIGFRHLNDTSPSGEYFGKMSLIEGILALSGILLLDLINIGYFKGDFRSILKDWTTLPLGFFCFLGMVAIQVISQVPMTIRDAEMAGAIIFAGPAEELFFRGVLISMFQKISNSFPDQKIIEIRHKKIGIIDISGIIISSLLFASLHMNYYSDSRLMVVTFLTGLFLGTFYLLEKDITANIIGHLLLNIIVVGQTFWVINL